MEQASMVPGMAPGEYGPESGMPTVLPRPDRSAFAPDDGLGLWVMERSLETREDKIGQRQSDAAGFGLLKRGYVT